MKRAVAALLLLAARVASAEVVLDGDTRWSVELPPDFERDDPPPQIPEATLLASYHGPGGRQIAVLRLRANTDGAKAGNASYFAGLEAGVKNEADGYRRLSATPRKLGRTGKLPAYDLWYRSGDAVVGTRFVLLSGYALILTARTPRARRADAAARRVVERFVPIAATSAEAPLP